MSNPPSLISLKSLTTVAPAFTTVNAQTDALLKTTGLTIHELMAEAIEHERQKMISGEDSKQYIKLLTTVFGKFAVGAPVHTITETNDQPLTREDIKARIDNYITRIKLSTVPKSE